MIQCFLHTKGQQLFSAVSAERTFRFNRKGLAQGHEGLPYTACLVLGPNNARSFKIPEDLTRLYHQCIRAESLLIAAASTDGKPSHLGVIDAAASNQGEPALYISFSVYTLSFKGMRLARLGGNAAFEASSAFWLCS